MASGLEAGDGIAVEIIIKTKEAYRSEDHKRSNLPAAPAVMIGDDIIVQGADLSEKQLEEAIAGYLFKSGENTGKG